MIQDNSEGRLQADPPAGGAGSLRTRLVATSVIITALAIAAMGYYVFFRGRQATDALADQLESNIRQQAEANLDAVSSEQVSILNAFFGDMRRDIADAGTSAAELLSQQPAVGPGGYWDALTSVFQLPSGSWDNPSTTDPASVFLPVQARFDETLAAQLNTLKYLDFVVPGKLQGNPDAVAVYFGGPSGETLYYPNIDLANVVPPDFDVTQRPWYLNAAPGQNSQGAPSWTEPYLDAALHGLVVTTSVPVVDARGAFRGVIAMDVQLGRISEIVSNIRVGETGYAFLIDSDKRLIALPEAGYADLGLQVDQAPLGESLGAPQVAAALPEGLTPLLDRMAAGQTGLDTVTVAGSERFAVYRPVPGVGYSMAILVPIEELLAGALAARSEIMVSSTNTTQISLVLVAVILLLASLGAAMLANTLTAPLVALTQTAEEITAGNLNARAPVRSRDEIGMLGLTLNSMTDTLRELVQSLEQRVRERTSALAAASEDANRRAAQFEAVTRVTRAISSIRNVTELMRLVTGVISEAFGYYHVGVFLNDESTQNAYLIAANSEGGRRMLGRHHSLKIGEQGIVGFVAARGDSRVARNVGEDVVFFNNPDLPATRSEAALPLRIGTRIVGVLDVQSTKEDAFRADDLRVLEVLADQVSLAIENTRLLEATQRSLTETETLYRQYVREAWRRFQPDERVTGYRFTSRGSMPLHEAGGGSAVSEPAAEDGDLDTAAEGLRVPIKLRGETIGDLVVHRPPEGGLGPDQLELIQAVADRVALSVENARLFDETGRRAARERLVTEITSKIRSSNDPQAMMSTALEELKNALGASRVQIVPQTVSESKDDEGGSAASPPRSV
ncbi:MAG: cache domain-containing protein [Chloroflexota bacterium]